MADPSPYQIAGNLPFQAGGNPLAAAGDLNALAGQYQQSYNSALAQNQANYQNILGGYQQVLGGQVGAQEAIGAGYNQLYNTVLGGLQGSEASRRQEIGDYYAALSGQQAQGLIGRGLGNTTVADSMRRGVAADETKAQTALSNQMAQMMAGYQSQLGQAGLGQSERAAMANSGLSAEQLRWMNSITSAYPNAQQYYDIFQQQGMAGQAAADRSQLARLGRGGGAMAMTPRGSAGGRNSPLTAPSLGVYRGYSPQLPATYGGGGNYNYLAGTPVSYNLGNYDEQPQFSDQSESIYQDFTSWDAPQSADEWWGGDLGGSSPVYEDYQSWDAPDYSMGYDDWYQ